MRQAPRFGRIDKGLAQREAALVVHKGDIRSPGGLDDVVAEHGDALAEKTRGQLVTLDDLAGLELDLAQGRLPVQTGAFIKIAAVKDETLGEGFGIMGIDVDHPVGVERDGLCGRRARHP